MGTPRGTPNDVGVAKLTCSERGATLVAGFGSTPPPGGITMRFKLSIGLGVALAALATAAPAMADVDPNGYTATK